MSDHGPATRSGATPRTGLAITSLVLGILALPSAGCLGIGALLGLIFGIVALVKANRDPQSYGGKGLAIGGIVTSALSIVMLPATLGIIAAIAIPSLLRARVSANEAAAIGDIRTVISAEAAYQSASSGAYGTLDCLASPQGCIPGYQGPSFLDPQLASAQVKQGYRRQFHAGPPAAGATGPSSFAYVAVPAQQNRTGVRSFCGDASGRICAWAGGSEPVVQDGRCDPGCLALP